MTPYRMAGVLLMTGMASAPCHVSAQTGTYPEKPVRVIVGLAPGGGTDIQARLFSQKLSESLGRPFIVENRTGAGGTIAYGQVARASADGYTLLAVASGYSITPAIYSKLSYDPVKDFAPISLVVQAPLLLLTHPSVPVKSVRDLLAIAKAKPGVLDFASAGYGSSTHMALELFITTARVNVTHVPYKGTGLALIDTIAGQVHAMFANILSSLVHVRSGRLHALAVTTLKRSRVLPEVPTVSETGVPGYEDSTWHGWLAPAGTPVEIVDKLSAELGKSVRLPDVIERLTADGGEPVGTTPEQFTRHLVTEIGRWRTVVRDAGIRVQ